jgi:hypothetical protein|tara:strand:- start:127 stop:471 length:345 start_codon:yes stop_codon:yes gene_type:complete
MGIEFAEPTEVLSTLEELNPEAIMYDGFDDALVGIVARCGTEPLALYDREKCIQLLVGQGLTNTDAEDYFCYNVEGCYAGPHTPFIGSFNLDPVGVPRTFADVETEILVGMVEE